MSITRIEEALRKAKEAKQAPSPVRQPVDRAPQAAISEPTNIPVSEPPVSPVVRPAVRPVVAPPGISFRFDDGRIVNVPFSRLRKNRVITAGDKSRWVARFRDLQLAVQGSGLIKSRAPVVAVMSANPREGRTLCAINLAMSLAASGAEPVILVDMDFFKPAIHAFLEIQPDAGLTDVLGGGKAIAEILVRAEAEKLILVPAGPRSRSHVALLTRDNVRAVIGKLRSLFPSSALIVDLPPLSLNIDTSIFEGIVDHVVLVVEEGKTPREDVLRVLGKLKNVEHVDMVLNKALESSI
ncbi:MAG: receptor protein-tyrosine kinase [Gammaproteobacteria bacterium]|nr:MAG: receptor protein-tyrosine kinase [Gammaproteobacteria bacterium]TND07068.1 MAG: receptor protein-tyrosine kinase [Gammaproteobacteria bacterium]